VLAPYAFITNNIYHQGYLAGFVIDLDPSFLGVTYLRRHTCQIQCMLFTTKLSIDVTNEPTKLAAGI